MLATELNRENLAAELATMLPTVGDGQRVIVLVELAGGWKLSRDVPLGGRYRRVTLTSARTSSPPQTVADRLMMYRGME
jgi:hypothetical protein